MGKLVKRSQRIAYYGVPTSAESGSVTYTRMTKFTSMSKSKNPKTYSRQYVDEDASIEDVVGYAESISYAFDEEVGNGGFGYDPVFIPDLIPGPDGALVPNSGSLTLAQISEDDKNLISHRGMALRAMASWLHGR